MILIAIDHGNKQIKTIHNTFSSGLCESNTKPPFGENVLFYCEKYYTLSEQRIPYMRDKTTDERYFVLTLFAITFELKNYHYPPNSIINLNLAIGLPPAHYGSQYKKFENYFADRGVIKYELDGKKYNISINNTMCFPQAYAAVLPIYPNIHQMPKAVIIDIGGFTADYLLIKNGQADLSVCDSLENGVITFYNRIKSKINSDYDILLDESDIDAVLQDKQHEYNDEIEKMIKEQAQLFVDDLFSQLRERKIDLKTGKTLFVGGGSILFHKQIEVSQKVGNKIYIDEISANVKGYEILYRASNSGR